MAEKIHEYTKDDLTVVWDASKCIHAKHCWKQLYQVFRPRERPWVNLDGASSDRIRKQIEKCPSGALSYKGQKTKSMDTNDDTMVRVIKGGPLQVLSTCKVTHADGTEEVKENRASFCRCGASKNKPYCDGGHRDINWTE